MQIKLDTLIYSTLYEELCDERDLLFVTLEHKTSLKSLGYICSNSQQYIVWVRSIDFSFMPNIISKLSKDHVP